MLPPTILPQNNVKTLDKFTKEFQYCSINHNVNVAVQSRFWCNRDYTGAISFTLVCWF